MEGCKVMFILNKEGLKTGYYLNGRNDLTREQSEILSELREVSKQLICTDLWFQTEIDSNLIESCIYQREALSARYKHLISQARKQNITSGPFEKYVG